MKKFAPVLIFLAFCCNPEKNPADKNPVPETGNTGWMIYEGRVPLDETRSLFMELSLLPGAVAGEGKYSLAESLLDNNDETPISSFTGVYSTLYGNGPEELIIHLHSSSQAEGVKRTYLINTGFKEYFSKSDIKRIREGIFRNTDLTLRPEGKNKLIVLDQELIPLSRESHFNLAKRASGLFTLEGYFRHNGDTADFLEMNTKQKWAVSKLGQYTQATRQYHKLEKDKFEFTYLKAVGFSIQHTNRKGKETEALVFKRILEMTSSPAIAGEDKAIILESYAHANR
jgi:hypothetical protein